MFCFPFCIFLFFFSFLALMAPQHKRNNSGTHSGFSDGRQDGSADHARVGMQPEVVKQQTGGQKHRCWVCRVAVGDALPRVPGALQ